MQTRSDSSPNGFPRLDLRRAPIDLLKTSLNLGKPGSLDAIIRRFVEASDQQPRDIRPFLWRKL
jgi:hypothetical protein